MARSTEGRGTPRSGLDRAEQVGDGRSQMGPGGGALLARPAEQITLADVYRAIHQNTELIPIHPSPNPACPVGRTIQSLLDRRFRAAEQALEDELGRTTVADL
ncbi:MAG: Rrf2 family transcriptional regulator, partial [Acidobacteriota bacterium]